MSERTVVTVKGLLPEEMPEMADAARAELAREGTEGLPQYAWSLIGSKATEAVRDEMNGDVYELLAKAWCFADELREYADETLHPPAEKSIVFLGKHDLTSTVHPTITVTVAGKSLPPLKLTLELTGEVRAAALTIQGGHILSVSSGDCSVSAQLKCGEVPLHKKLAPRPALLPGTYTLDKPGLRIQPQERAK